MPILYCEPVNGLANRLMMIVSCIRLAKKMNYELVIVWKDDPVFICDYNAIFGDKFNYVKESPSIPPYPLGNLPRLWVNFDEIRGQDLYLKTYHFIFSTDDLNSLSDLNRAKIQITHELKQAWSEIVPSNKVIEKLHHKSFDLGIHVRRSMDVDTTDWSKPSDSFISNLSKNFITQNNIKSLYLCSVSPETTNFIKDELLGLNVDITTSSSNSWDLNNLSTIQAYVDMLHLASCRHIIRFATTTFSALPSLVSAETEVVYTENESFVHRQPLVFSGAAL